MPSFSRGYPPHGGQLCGQSPRQVPSALEQPASPQECMLKQWDTKQWQELKAEFNFEEITFEQKRMGGPATLLTSVLDKLARLFMTIAAELWLGERSDSVDTVFSFHCKAFYSVRLAEALAQYLSFLMRKAESLVTPETECLLKGSVRYFPSLLERPQKSGT